MLILNYVEDVANTVPQMINILNAKLKPICHFLALLGAHQILHVRKIRGNMINEADKSLDAERTNHQRLIVLANIFYTMAPNIFTIRIAVLFHLLLIIIITITTRHDKALRDLFRPQ